MKKFLIMLFRRFVYCDHEIKHLGNVYGDNITYFNCRSHFQCEKCGKIFRSEYLYEIKK
ncbi:MAG: hypothetical protein ACRDDY_03420 [Clostridium sp.]|uniref:hypothetical protein n=1 Tax=Clostridium sp. TaxID=1506 RepID=UPI003EE48F15